MILLLLQCCLIFQTYEQFALYSNSFETNSFTDSDGWQIVNGLSSNLYNQCGTDRIFGGISSFGYMTLISKFFTLPPHSKIKVQLDFWKISNWQNDEIIYLHLDGLRVIEQEVVSLPIGSNICGGNDFVLLMDSSILHNFESLQVIVEANIAFQSSIKGFWGIKNFRLFIQECPAGCLLCQDSDSRLDCLKWTLYASSLTETISQLFNREGWNLQNGQSQQSQDCLNIPMLCGPNVCGNNSIIQYEQILPPHFKLKIRFRFYYIDSWDLEQATLSLNDQVIFSKQVKYFQNLKNYSLCGQSRFNDLSDIEDIEVSHSQQLATFQFSNNLDQPLDDESFGIRDFRIYLYCQFGDYPSQQCSQFCGDSIVQKTEECDDGNILPFDGCHNCQYDCCEGCSNCIKGLCLECYEGWEYQAAQQQCKWLGLELQKNLQNGIISGGSLEQQNEISQQKCSLNCKLCYQDICLECQVGYNLLVGECQEICGVSAISMFEFPNCFCDQNCELCNFGLCQQCIDITIRKLNFKQFNIKRQFLLKRNFQKSFSPKNIELLSALKILENDRLIKKYIK